jgi:hypothetical protein
MGYSQIDRSEAVGLMTLADVEARLIEALRVLWRLGDREAGWLRVKAFWPDIVRETHVGDHDARGGDMVAPALRPLPATRRDVVRMEESMEWVLAVKPEDRRLIGLAIGALARGAGAVPWMALRRPMGVKLGAHGLRKRYGRAMRLVVQAANAGLLRASACQTV